MRKIVLPLIAAGAALAVASPAAAQSYPSAQPYGYGYGYGQVRALQVRIDNVQRQIERLDRIGDRSADRLRDDANNIEYRLRRSARGGLNPYEARRIEYQIQRLEQRVQYSMNDRRWGDRDRWDRDHRDRD
jgi:hypothetical protein